MVREVALRNGIIYVLLHHCTTVSGSFSPFEGRQVCLDLCDDEEGYGGKVEEF